MKKYCDVCNVEFEGELYKCDTCGRYYCEDCSYTYSMYYQFQGSRCYECSDQHRIKPISKIELRENIINRINNENND